LSSKFIALNFDQQSWQVFILLDIVSPAFIVTAGLFTRLMKKKMKPKPYSYLEEMK